MWLFVREHFDMPPGLLRKSQTTTSPKLRKLRGFSDSSPGGKIPIMGIFLGTEEPGWPGWPGWPRVTRMTPGDPDDHGWPGWPRTAPGPSDSELWSSELSIISRGHPGRPGGQPGTPGDTWGHPRTPGSPGANRRDPGSPGATRGYQGPPRTTRGHPGSKSKKSQDRKSVV